MSSDAHSCYGEGSRAMGEVLIAWVENRSLPAGLLPPLHGAELHFESVSRFQLY
ncbi:hypothetical protein COCC4DRAFT_31499 [Bipolaris maydis ATCC 48331]|uniref:Uncharacterized protein n=5 Tax=Bipolaris TaxID=33194 RepID=M2SLH7_COCH5|nr:uncharacterized protein COCMIDRAFT_36841 [Bipolaris oryzae ATCC 44560]XP_007714376.1 uncharacterized protein COCCADRAFT_101563 [Bipolaris zeicola 26-R-13]XP_014080057.1 uncharacterized protein COCC4DRAFT_31499 [Bipolaris maydis ATCC 48331]XP_014553858.1 hypothetical protein COCVIDRAFT_106511 [Bipolaris victoriae FI3]EMD86200.1 hypothetical protein COCHEDRAFT_1023954 [Bipolaris maydis C5]ENI06148.1 hypothetical protein COCC4DRAFT_31499 [Bipolaris maydis ATCC 48331]EUC31306.1 hypothetical pr